MKIGFSGPITLGESSFAPTAVLNEVGLGYFMVTDVREDVEAGRLGLPTSADRLMTLQSRRSASGHIYQ